MAANARKQARLVLQPCKVVGHLIVADQSKGRETYSWTEICALLKIATDVASKKLVRTAKSGDYFGLVASRVPKKVSMFYLSSDGEPRASLQWIERKRRGFSACVESIYRLEIAHWGGKVIQDSYQLEN